MGLCQFPFDSLSDGVVLGLCFFDEHAQKGNYIRLCRYELAGDSGCSCIFLLAVLIRASADISYVGNSFGSLLDRSQVLPMNHRLTLLSRVQIRRLHFSFCKSHVPRFYDIEHAAAADLMAYFSHMIARLDLHQTVRILQRSEANDQAQSVRLKITFRIWIDGSNMLKFLTPVL